MDEAPEFTPAQAADPSTPGEVLAAIAGSRPDLRPYVAANPAAYPGLLDWLGQLGDPAVDGALRARVAAQPAPAYEAPQEPREPVARPDAGDAEAEAGPSAQTPVTPAAEASPDPAAPGGFAAPTAYVPPAASGGGAYAYAGQDPAPGSPYGAPEAGAQPYGAPAGGPYGTPGGEPPKKSKAWLWVLLGVVGVVIIGGIVIAVVLTNVLRNTADDVGGVFNTTDATNYGDSAELDALWDSCEAGEMPACDELFNEAEAGSEYKSFGDTCGDRTDGGQWCEELAVDGGAATPADPPASTSGDPAGYGDDAALDALWDGCEDGDMGACDDLYRESPFGSEYEDFGDSCGGRTDGGTWCASTE